ncbi:methyl-accepting chemotaxis protein, partial [Desulfomicrobium escambiense]|uniref:methyl-accepting chemotaxis protein n=1 Tax=Desulfomicrobium escambiense TaxID=29503 RepID=UPI00048CBC54
MKNIKLGLKLIGGFCMTAIIALIIGLVCIAGMRGLSGSIETLGNVSLPSVEHLLRIKGNISDLSTNLRTLLSAELSAQDRRDIPVQIQGIREYYKKSADTYTALPRTAAEDAKWKECQATLATLAGANNKVLELNQHLLTLDIMNPDDLMGRLQQYRGDHYKLMTEVGKLMATGEAFEGGTDHTACGFGKWAAGFSTANAQLKGAMDAVAPNHQAFHQTIREIKELTAAGRGEEAKAKYMALLPIAENVFTQFRAMRGQAEDAQKAFQEMGRLLMVESKATQAKLDGHMLELVELGVGESQTAVQGARQEANKDTAMAIGGMVVGVIIALTLGLLLTRSITGPVYKGVDFARKLAQGDLTAEVDVNQKDELGILAQALREMVAKLREVVSEV